ncbi:transmembrane protein 248 [Myripristis murdjan]|uniref:Transmembrane protein 248-like n=1 Tax=Myripristis murdjan TaxID=586833 RepID=A0A667Y7G3_9TELE|nr:transmembrane protein 248-like [Myripristis murdjan]
MGFWQPVNNLRDYVSQNPPGVTFFLCLLTLALSFICLSSYIHTHTLPNPDTAKDWNHLLSALSQFQLCVKANVSSVELLSPASPPLEHEASGKPSVSPGNTQAPVTQLHLKVPLVVSPSSASQSPTGLRLHSNMMASQLGLAGNETVNVTLHFESGNDTHTCLTISAPTHLLPRSVLPPYCPESEKVISPLSVVSLETSSQSPTASHLCYSLQSRHDPTLMIMLTQEQQGVAGRHLLEVSVFLLAICLMLALSASLTHSLARRYHGNGLDLHSEPLMDS